MITQYLQQILGNHVEFNLCLVFNALCLRRVRKRFQIEREVYSFIKPYVCVIFTLGR